MVTNTSYETFNGEEEPATKQPGILSDFVGLLVLAVLAGALLIILYTLKNGGGLCRVDGTNSDSDSESAVYTTTDIEASSYDKGDFDTRSYQDLQIGQS